MFKVDIGDYLYYIIFAVVMLAGLLEKAAKAKQKQQDNTPRPPQSYDDFDDVDEEQPSSRQAPPQTIEEMMRRVLQTIEIPEQEKTVSCPEKTQSPEIIPEKPYRTSYQPIVTHQTQTAEISTPAALGEEQETDVFYDFEFDIRQAVIANEILNRKY